MVQPIPKALQGWRVLIVDDESDSLEVASRLLKFAGANVVTAVNGLDALEKVRSVRPQLIITDLSMPEMDGWGLLQQLKLERDTLEIPVIALTAHTMSGDRERAIAAGFHNHIPKPLDPIRFISQLINIVVDIPELKAQLSAPI